MNAALAVFRLEFRERLRILIIALPLAVLPFVFAARLSSQGRGDTIAALAIWSAIVYALSVAFVIGGSTLGRPLVEKRMSFYLSRPISAVSLWGGKLAAGIAVCAAASAVIALPALLAVPLHVRAHFESLSFFILAWVSIGVPLLFLTGHVASTFLRSRSIRVLIDLVCLVAAVTAVSFLVRPLFIGGAFRVVGVTLALAGVALLLLLAAAPVWQLTRGRGVIRESHAALSNALWTGVAVIVAVIAGVSLWVTSAPISSIRQWGVFQQSTDGRWLVVTGTSDRGDLQVNYLINTEDGTSRRLAASVPWSETKLSGDGQTLLTPHSTGFLPGRGGTEYRFTPLGSGGVRGAITTKSWATETAITSDASRFAVVTPDAVSVHEPATGTMLAAARINGRKVRSLYFASPALLRVVSQIGSGDRYEIYEVDVDRKRLARTGGFTSRRPLFVVSDDASRLLLVEGDVVDARTGECIAKSTEPLRATILSGGHLAGTARHGATPVLDVYAPDFSGEQTIPLPVDDARIVAQVGSLKVLLNAGDRLLLVDIGRRQVVWDVKGARIPPYRGLRLLVLPEDGAIAGLAGERKLATWEVATGKKREL